MSRPHTAPIGLLTAALALGGCVSATPRAYVPLVRPPPADPLAFQRDYKGCATEVARGKRNFGQSGGAIAAGAVGTAAAVPVLSGAAVAASSMGSAGTMLAASSVGLVMIVPVLTYSLSKAHRRRNEEEIQKAMTACLAPRGYSVAAWNLIPKDAADSTANATPTRSSSPPND